MSLSTLYATLIRKKWYNNTFMANKDLWIVLEKLIYSVQLTLPAHAALFWTIVGVRSTKRSLRTKEFLPKVLKIENAILRCCPLLVILLVATRFIIENLSTFTWSFCFQKRLFLGFFIQLIYANCSYFTKCFFSAEEKRTKIESSTSTRIKFQKLTKCGSRSAFVSKNIIVFFRFLSVVSRSFWVNRLALGVFPSFRRLRSRMKWEAND